MLTESFTREEKNAENRKTNEKEIMMEENKEQKVMTNVEDQTKDKDLDTSEICSQLLQSSLLFELDE